VPTGVALRDPRDQLFEAAERVLLRDGAPALTSRAVTTEAGVAKGVLHRHFPDFDAFVAELILDRAARVRALATALLDRAGTATVADNVAEALTTVFGPVALAIVSLLIFRDDLRARLRAARPKGLPVLTDAAEMLAAYLTAERDLGRIAAATDTQTVALTLIGTAHVVFADGADGPPSPQAVRHFVTTALGPAVVTP
jgi:AcrR family transcriptional regulator